MRAAAPAVDYSKKWLVLLAVGMGIFLSTIDGSIVNVALPTLVDEFGTTFAAIQWVVLGYLLTLGTLTLIVGRLGDMLGKKRIYTAGFSVFTVASMAAGLASSVPTLVGFRVIQAIGAAMILSLGIAILTEGFPPEERGKALGFAGTMVSVGIVIGPALGGFLIDSLGWRWIFFVNLPVGIVGTLTAMRYVPNVAPPGKQTFDWAGATAMFAALLTLLIGLTAGQERGFTDRLILVLFAASLVSLVGFVLIERRARQPMINLAMFANRLFTINLVTGFLTFVAIAGVFIVAPFYLSESLGMDPRTMGLLLAVSPIVLGIVAPLSGSLSDRIGSRPITVAGLAVLVAGYAAMTRLGVETSTLGFVLLFAPVGVGMGMFQSPNNSIVMGSVRPERLGIASGLLSLTRILGQITGIAVLGTIWAARTARAGLGNAASAVAGLHDMLWVIVAMMAVALALAVWGWVRERRTLL